MTRNGFITKRYLGSLQGLHIFKKSATHKKTLGITPWDVYIDIRHNISMIHFLTMRFTAQALLDHQELTEWKCLFISY